MATVRATILRQPAACLVSNIVPIGFPTDQSLVIELGDLAFFVGHESRIRGRFQYCAHDHGRPAKLCRALFESFMVQRIPAQPARWRGGVVIRRAARPLTTASNSAGSTGFAR